MLTKLFLSCTLGAFFTTVSIGQMTFVDYYTESMTRAQDYTIELVEIMPEDKFDFKPVDEVSTLRDQLNHVI